MTVSLKEVFDNLSPEHRQQVEKRAKELITEEMILRDLRKDRALTQVEIMELADPEEFVD